MIDQVWLRGLRLLLILVFWGSDTVSSDRLLLTEVFYDTPGSDANQEWIEIANVGSAVAELSTYKLSDEESSGGGEGAWRFPVGAKIAPSQVIVVAQTATGFRELYGIDPHYEIHDSDPTVPDMRPYRLWAIGDLALANDGDEVLLLDDRNVIRDAVNYGQVNTYFSPAVQGVLTGQSIERVPASCDSDSAADWLPQVVPTPGQIQYEGECRIPQNPAELESLPPIGQIQGKGPVSPYVNQVVNFRGVVTGAYEDRNTRGIIYYTLFVQDIPGYEDGDPATSDGIGVFLGRERPDYGLGDQVNVTGLVTEFFGFSEIADDALLIQKEAGEIALPPPIPIDPPAGNEAQFSYLEPLEGMLVGVDGVVQVVGPTHVGCGFEVTAGRPGLKRILRRNLDDPTGHIIPILHTSDVLCDDFPQVKSGDLISGIAGPLVYSFDQFKIVQQETASLEVKSGPWQALPAPPARTDEQISLTTFNLGNFFDETDDTGDDAEPVLTAAQSAAKQQKLAYAITQILGCPTIIAVQEMENAKVLKELTTAAAASCGFVYEISHRESPDSRGIDLALLSDPRQVRVQAIYLRQTCTSLATGILDETMNCPAGQNPLFSRPPLEVRAEIGQNSYIFLVNHFKSKRGGEMATAPQRLEQARHINELVDLYLAADEKARIVALGDFNDYEQSPTLQMMTGQRGRLTSALRQLPDDERYSYIFGGASQLLDGILLSPGLTDALIEATILHINADYPEGLAMDTSVSALPYRSSDHDLPLILLAVDDNEDSALPPEVATAATDVRPENRFDWSLTVAAIILLALGAVAGLTVVNRWGKYRSEKRS